ncbi:MAG TPA: hypothetical protein VHB19_01305 [Devosia sp.]|jgi:hypothetical protein|nr:hypothetical protein [Devosia sp.]
MSAQSAIAALPPDARGLGDLAADLGAARAQIETAFVTVGDWLTQSAQLLNRLSQTFEALPRDLASAELTEATTRLAAVGSRAAEISASFAAEQTAIERLVSVVTAAETPISDLRRAVRMMGIVAINARVVAAGIVGNDHDFDVFTTDIAQLANSATRTIEEFSAVYRQLTGEVHRAAAQRAQFEATHRNTLSRLAQRLEQNLGEIVARRKLSADGSAETGRVTHEIAGRVGSAVMAMQVGDSTRQRLEHIEAALAHLASLAGGGGVPGLDIHAADVPELLTDGLTLETLQLDATARSFNAEIAEAGDALAALATDAGTVIDKSRDIYGARGQSPLTAFNAEIHAALAVLRDCEAEREKLASVAGAVDRIVQVLLGHVEAVREIEANMRLVSLNAAVRCAQLGPRGRALNVIAMQLRELTGETVLAAEASMTSLGEAASLAQSFSASSGGEAAGQVAWLEQEAARSADLLGAVDLRLNDALALLDRDGPTVIKALAEAAARLAAHEQMSEAIADAALRCAQFAGDDAPPAAAPTSAPLLALLRKSYTMEAERRVHDGFAGAPPPAAAAADDVEGLLF